MRKISYLTIAAAALLSLAGCQKDTNLVTLGIVQEDLDGHKAIIDGTNTPRLTGDGSEVMLINNGTCTVEGVPGNVYVRNVQQSDAGTYRCVYPASLVAAGTNITNMTTVPVVYATAQTYATTTVEGTETQVVSMPMVANGNNKTLFLKNAAGIVRVNVTNTSNSDLAVTSIKVSAGEGSNLYDHGTVSMNGIGNSMTTTIGLDASTTPVESFSLSMGSDGVTIAAGASQSFDIVVPPTTAAFTIEVFGTGNALAGSKTLSSRTLQRNMIAIVNVDAAAGPQTLYFNGFEDGTLGDITLLDLDNNQGELYNWHIGGRTLGWFPYDGNNQPFDFLYCSGTYCIYSASFINYDGAYQADNWAVLPRLHIPSEGAYLTYKAGLSSWGWPDHYEIWVTTSSTLSDVANSTSATMVFSGTPNVNNDFDQYDPGLFEQAAVDLSSFAGQDVYIAFRHYDYDQWAIALDDIGVYAGTAPTPSGSAKPAATPAANRDKGPLAKIKKASR